MPLTQTEIERGIRRTERRAGVDQDRRTGKRPVVVERVGDITFFWATTGMLVSGSTATVYFTDTAEARGQSLYTRMPQVEVWRNEILNSGVGMVRAANPLSNTDLFRVRANYVWNYYKEVFWDEVHFTWGCVVSNSVGVTQDFLVQATGV